MFDINSVSTADAKRLMKADTTRETSRIAERITAVLVTEHGIYSGNWTEKSIRSAGTGDMDTLKSSSNPAANASPVLNAITQTHPAKSSSPIVAPRRSRNESAVFGHWLLPDGTLSGQLADHAKSAENVLNKVGLPTKGDPIFSLMGHSGVVRVRIAEAPGRGFGAKTRTSVLDIMRRPTRAQLEAMLKFADEAKATGGHFMFSVVRPGDTGEIASGSTAEDLLNVPWERI